ncbi:MAG: hypothetical protein MRZ09_06330 [Coprobacillus sp.]|nr:hypothetical protein [Coprobacillus sp.]
MSNSFRCEYCLRTNGHNIGCPNYVPPTTGYICSLCKEDILIGEKYVINDNGNYAHLECLADVQDTLYWLGYEIKEY